MSPVIHKARPLLCALALAVLLATVVGLPTAGAAVTDPDGTSSVIAVAVRGDSDPAAPAIPLPLAGVQLQLHEDGTTAGPALTDDWATCTSDADGDCVFKVPDTAAGGANEARRFWVVGQSVPTGWFAVGDLRTGLANNITTSAYQFRTPAMVAGETFESGSDFMTTSAADTGSSGWWQQSRANPTVPATLCGLRIALVLDLSYSIDATELAQLKAAGVGFVDGLEGTPSSIAVYTFGTTAPAAGANNTTLGLTSVATADGADEVRGKIENLDGQAGYTNWDRGLLQVAQSSDEYDAVLFITDGNPTAHSGGTLSPAARTRFNEVERGIFSANAVKAEGTRIFGVGILGGTTTDPEVSLNLQAVSGPNLGSDFFLVEDFEALGDNLRDAALNACLSTVSVVKRVIPAGGTIDDAAPAAGWTFTATSPVEITPGSATTPESGAVNFSVDLGAESSAPVTIAETPQQGFELVPQAGANAVCTRLDDGTAVAVTNQGDTGFVVDALIDSGITCQVINQAPGPNPQANPSIDLVKTADVASVDAVGDVITYTFTATNNGEEALTDVRITDPLPGLSDLTCTPAAPATLAIGQSMSCTGTYTVTQDDLDAGSIHNVATATGTGPSGSVESTDDHTVPGAPPSGIAIVKTPSATQVQAGTEVTFSYAVTNTGGAALSAVTVSDDKCSPVTFVTGDSDNDQRLDVDETWTFTCTTTITQTTTNVGTASGQPPTGAPVTGSDEATVTVGQMPRTGGPAWTASALLIALGMVAAGTTMLLVRRRRTDGRAEA